MTFKPPVGSIIGLSTLQFFPLSKYLEFYALVKNCAEALINLTIAQRNNFGTKETLNICNSKFHFQIDTTARSKQDFQILLLCLSISLLSFVLFTPAVFLLFLFFSTNTWIFFSSVWIFFFYVVWKIHKDFCENFFLVFFFRLPQFFFSFFKKKLFIELRRVRVLALYELNSRVFWLRRKNCWSSPNFFRMRFGLYNSFTCVTIFFRRFVVCTILYNKNVILFFLLLLSSNQKNLYDAYFFLCVQDIGESERIWKKRDGVCVVNEIFFSVAWGKKLNRSTWRERKKGELSHAVRKLCIAILMWVN